MSLKDCIDAAVAAQHLTIEEAAQLKKRYDSIARQVFTTGEAKRQLVAEMEFEADKRKARALLTERARSRLLDTIKGYRNIRGEADYAEAFLLLFETYGERGGTFIASAENLRQTLVDEYMAQMTNVLQEFRRGAVTGDLKRRWNPATRQRMEAFVSEIFGQDSGDPVAKALADAWTQTAEAMRVRFNDAGGAVGKLDYGYLPQGHDQEAVLNAGRSKWIAYIMPLLDRDRTVHPISKRKMSDDELVEALGVVWDRITTDGAIDAEITGARTDRGALWTQHADHRFLHFKDAKTWMQYARDFGSSTDVWHAMSTHIQIMARDIAHMETFGPNPNVTIQYMKNWLSAQVAQIKSFDVVIDEQTQRLTDLHGRLTNPDPTYEQTARRMGQIHKELAAIRNRYRPQLGGQPSKRDRVRMDALLTELARHEQIMAPYYDGSKPIVVEDLQIRAEIEALQQEMREPITFATTSRPGDYLRSTFARADAMWSTMRGSSNTPVNTRLANSLAATRNMMTAAMLSRAIFAATSDAATAMDTLQQMGVAWSKTTTPRLLATAFREALAKTTREDAARAWLGWDSMTMGFQQQARFSGAIDVRSWTGFVADRVLTTTLLSPFTQGMKHIVGTTIMAEFADLRGKIWTELPDAQRTVLARNGFDAASWDAIRVADINEALPGKGWLEPNGIATAAGRELAERYHMMIKRMTRMAVIESTVASRSIIGGDPPGTVKGELMRALLQFKGYPLALVMLRINPLVREVGAADVRGKARALRYFGALVISGTIIAAVSAVLRDVSQGRDPRKWFDENTYLDPFFWVEAFFRSVGLGIYGDLLKEGTTAHGRDTPQVLSGPLIGLGMDAMGLVGEATVRPVQSMIAQAQGRRPPPSRLGRRAVRVARQITPTHFLTDIALQRMIFDQLQIMVDPEAYKAFRDQQVRQRRVNAQEFYWPPGEALPTRAPDLARPIATR
jgi:hypothetical protein